MCGFGMQAAAARFSGPAVSNHPSIFPVLSWTIAPWRGVALWGPAAYPLLNQRSSPRC